MPGYVLVGIWDDYICSERAGKAWLQGEPDLHLEEPCRKIFETSAWVPGAHVLLKGTRSQLQKLSSGFRAEALAEPQAPEYPQKHNHHSVVHQGAHSSPSTVGAYISQSQPLQCILCIFKVFP